MIVLKKVFNSFSQSNHIKDYSKLKNENKELDLRSKIYKNIYDSHFLKIESIIF